MIEAAVYIAKASLVLLLGFAPGYLLAKCATRREGWELAANSVAFSLLFAAFSEFLAYLLNADAFFFNFSLTVLASALLFACARLKGIALGPGPRPPALPAFFALAFLAVVCVQALIPFYSGAYWYGDWWMHYDIARFYLDHAPLSKTWFPEHYTPTSRTPLFNLAGAYFMSLSGTEFWSFQIAASFMNAAFILPLALLAKRFGFSKYSSAALAVLLAVLNASVLTNECYTWSKLVISLFLLSAIYYYLDFRKQLLAGRMEASTAALLGIHAAGAYLSHQTALYYLIPVALDFAILSALLFARDRKKFASAGWKAAGIAAVAGLALLAPWHAWAFENYGVSETLSSSPALKAGITSQGFLEDRARNAVATLYPVFQQEWFGKWFPNSTPLDLLRCAQSGWQFDCYGFAYSVTLRFWLDVLPGALTLTGCAALAAIAIGSVLSGTWKKIADPEEPEFLFLLMLPISFVFGCLTTMYVDEKGWMPLFLPTLLILEIVIARSLSGWRRGLRAPVLALIIAEFVLVKGSHVYLLFTEQLTNYEPFNLPLKADNHLVFAFDYLGGSRIVFAALALLVYALLVACALILASQKEGEALEEKFRALLG
ncbi:MAG: hypothetical protein PHF51_04370 [Candidatus ainarchaeum sp.]|nr:hypothetical protein [Candidatus ainarchaeum sp.]